MKEIGKRGNDRLKELQEDPIWSKNKSERISESIKSRGGHSGKNNPMFGKRHSPSAKIKQSERAKERNLSCYEQATQTKIANGNAVPKQNKSEWEQYREKVINYTRSSWINYEHLINPNNYDRGKEYELDHKFSITEGFLNNIPPEVIGNHVNLELLPKSINRSKYTKCSISKEDLYERYSMIPSDSPSSDTDIS